MSETVTERHGEVLQTDRAEVRSKPRPQPARESPQLDRPKLPVAVRHPAGFRRHPVQLQFHSLQPLQGAGVQRQRRQLQHQQHQDRRRPIHQRLAAAESAYVPTLEAIETVNVVTSSFDAETGSPAAPQSTCRPRADQQLHGAAFENHDNQHLNARPSSCPYSQSKPKFVYNDFGGAAGGPIRKDKLFFFASYESTDNRESAFLHRHRAHRRDQERQHAGQTNPIYDPRPGMPNGANRTPFPNQTVPAARMDPIAAKLAAMTPLPNLAGNLLVQQLLRHRQLSSSTASGWTPKSTGTQQPSSRHSCASAS